MAKTINERLMDSGLPASVQTEVTVLGAMLLDFAALTDASARLCAEDFLLDSHQRIFRGIAALQERGDAVETLTLIDELKRRKELDAVGAYPYIAFLTDGIPRNPSIESYIRILRDRSLARKGLRICQEAQAALIDGAESATEVLDDLSRRLIIERPDDTKTAAEVMPRAMQRLQRGDHLIVPTGVPELDLTLRGGFRTKELGVIGAQPSGGKSALCRQIERAAVKMFLDSADRLSVEPFGVHVFSVEVSDEKWMLHHAARLAGLAAWKTREPELMSEIDKGYLRHAAEVIAKWPYRIDDAGSLTIDSLLAKARISAMRHNVKLITIDYLQLLLRDESNTAREMSAIARRLKQFAKDYDCAVVALSQLSRKGDINIRPTVQHLKESGDIEAAADVIILNYRPKDLEEGTYTGQDELIVGKQRDGGVGSIKQVFNADKLCFEPRGM